MVAYTKIVNRNTSDFRTSFVSRSEMHSSIDNSPFSSVTLDRKDKFVPDQNQRYHVSSIFSWSFAHH